MSTLEIMVVSDLVCSWCLVGERRLRIARPQVAVNPVW